MREVAVAEAAAVAAASLIRKSASGRKQVEVKPGDQGFVTNVDRDSEALILGELKRDSPYPVVSEESGGRLKADGYFWIVDPLDGTTNLINGIPYVGVSIALMEGRRVVAGVVVDAFSGDLFSAVEGQGAFYNGTRLDISSPGVRAPIVILNSGYGKESKLRFGRLALAFAPSAPIRRFGSSALELTLVARGAASAFVCSGDALWDYAAGMIIVREAKGAITDWNGRPNHGESDFVVAAAPWALEQTLETIRASGVL